MIISDIEFFLIELPARDRPARSLIVRVTADSGREGWGETHKAWRPNELAARRKALLAALAGREAYELESILALDALGDRPLACAVEMALWDLIARAAKLPLCKLWGGTYRGRVPLGVRLPDALEAAGHAAQYLAAQSIGTLIVGSSGSIERDLRTIRAVREACAERVQLRLDAGGQFRFEAAAELCSELEPGLVQYVLDPLSGHELDELALLNAQVRVPLAAYAPIERPADVQRVARLDAASFVVVDPVRVGGLARARQCAGVAEAAGLSANLQIEPSAGLALAATLHLAAATPSFSGAHHSSYTTLHDDLLVEPLALAEGMLTVPLAPGLGVEVDREKLDRYAVRA